MSSKIKVSQYKFDGSRQLKIDDEPNDIGLLYDGKKDYRKQLGDLCEEMDELQKIMYAHDRYSMLLVFQAMDAAGKDGTIRAVMSGINPHGVTIEAFKKPSEEEGDHGYLWRTNRHKPRRGHIGIFNRSYYEEVLVCKVHPEIVTDHQKLPRWCTEDMDDLWQRRYSEIRNMERYQFNNGTHVIKFFLNLSRDEQRNRFLARIDEPSKNWKFSESDVKERGFWNDYMRAYEDAINATAAPHAPWYVIPANDKKSMRLIVAQIILNHLHELDMQYPEVSEERRAELQRYREMLAND